MFNYTSVFKLAVSGVVGIGTGKIIKGVIASNVPTPANPLDKVTITAASWVISAIVTKASKTATNEMIDEVVGAVTKVFSEVKENQKLTRISNGESTFAREGLSENNYERNTDGKYVKKAPTDDETPDGWNLEDGFWVLREKGVVTSKIGQDDSGRWAPASN